MIKFIALVFLALIMGCGTPVTYSPYTEGGYQEKYPILLPKDAVVVEDKGNEWIVYKSNVLGTDRYFMIKYVYSGSSERQSEFVAFTELAPPALPVKE